MTDAIPEHATSIAVAPNGGRRTKIDHHALPISPNELADCAAKCAEAGANMIHVHVRDHDGRHSLDADAYRDAVTAIRRTVGDRLVIQVTSESLGLYGPRQQMNMVRQVRPEAVSLALRELLPDASLKADFAAFLNWLRSERIAPQFILYSPDEAIRLDALTRDGTIPFDEPPVLYVLGRYTVGQTSAPSDLVPFIAPGLPAFGHWATCAFGRQEAASVMAAALMGGNVRVGFENNLLLPSGQPAKDNAELVSVIANSLARLNMKIANADRLRSDWAIG